MFCGVWVVLGGLRLCVVDFVLVVMGVSLRH